MDSDDFKFLWYRIPTVSSESIKMYMYEVINFFKSYKSTILNINTIYKFDDKLDNAVGIIDRIRINYELHKSDMIGILDNIILNIYLNKKDSIDIREQIYIHGYNNKPRNCSDLIDIVDKISSTYVYLNKKSEVGIKDVIRIYGTLTKRTNIGITERLFINDTKIDLEEENI